MRAADEVAIRGHYQYCGSEIAVADTARLWYSIDALVSRALRLMFGAIALIAIGVAALLLIRTEREIGQRAASMRAFDQYAREAADALEEGRVGQHGYVAAGQGDAFWIDKVTASRDALGAALGALAGAATPSSRTAVEEAAASAREFGNIDQRVREYLTSRQPLMAADIIFSEGSDMAATAARQVETARLAEHQVFDRDVGELRNQQATILGAAASVVALVVLLLIPIRRAPAAQPVEDTTTSIAPSRLVAPPPATATAAAARPAPIAGSLLRTAATLATDFGRVSDLDELNRLLGRAASVLDASGLMVWMGSGGDLRPVLAHGYSSQMLARLPPVARSADNAAAAAYRSGTLQIVLARPGSGSGAVVAPILSADGCIGALSAEVRGGGETSELVQAMATIVASHLAGVLASTPAAEVAEARASASRSA
jgi:hypothetical protein